MLTQLQKNRKDKNKGECSSRVLSQSIIQIQLVSQLLDEFTSGLSDVP